MNTTTRTYVWPERVHVVVARGGSRAYVAVSRDPDTARVVRQGWARRMARAGYAVRVDSVDAVVATRD
jgi:hypothetical protein